MHIKQHWIDSTHSQIRYQPSPFCNSRPNDESPSLIVIHCISLPPSQFGGPYIDQLFTGKLDAQAHPYFEDIAALQVSAHCLIRRDGELVQYVGFNERAWHAGRSRYQGRENCNDFSVGIELEGAEHIIYETVQYQCLARLVVALRQHYPSLRNAPLVAHSDIAAGRKTDPGPGFNWRLLNRLMEHELARA